MNRRTFFGAISFGAAAGAYAVALGVVAASERRGLRVSAERGDPGERIYGSLIADGRNVVVHLDGILQPRAITADEAEGFVLRTVTTAEGNIAWNPATGEVLRERVYGHVTISVT